MSDIDRIVGGLDRISLLAQLRDKVVIAYEASLKRCGSCDHWMKSRECPSEHNVGGMSRGPSANEPACRKFQINHRSQDNAQRRIQEALDFAAEHNLPSPRATLGGQTCP